MQGSAPPPSGFSPEDYLNQNQGQQPPALQNVPVAPVDDAARTGTAKGDWSPRTLPPGDTGDWSKRPNLLHSFGAGVYREAPNMPLPMTGFEPPEWQEKIAQANKGMLQQPSELRNREAQEVFPGASDSSAGHRIAGAAGEGIGKAAPFAVLGPGAAVIGGAVSGGAEQATKEMGGGDTLSTAVGIGAGVVAEPPIRGLFNLGMKTLKSLPELGGVWLSRVNSLYSDLGYGHSRLAGATKPQSAWMEWQNTLRTTPGGVHIRREEDMLFQQIEARANALAGKMGPNQTQQELGEYIARLAGMRADEIPREIGDMFNALATVRSVQDVSPRNYLNALLNIKDKYAGAPNTGKLFEQLDIDRYIRTLGVDLLNNPGHTVPYSVIQNMRTDLGESVKKFIVNANVNTKEVRNLYRALTRDMESAYQTPEGLAAFKAVNAAAEQQFDRLTNVIQPLLQRGVTPEMITQRLLAQINKGGSRVDDITTELNKADPVARNAIMGFVLRDLGENNVGKFSPITFHNNWSKLSPEARDLFGMHQKGIDRLAELSGLVKESFAARNTSNTAISTNYMDSLKRRIGTMASIIGGGAGGLGGAAVTQQLADPSMHAAGLGMGAAGAITGQRIGEKIADAASAWMLEPGAAKIMARLWTSKPFNIWLASDPWTLPPQKAVAALAAVAAQDPDLAPAINYIKDYVVDPTTDLLQQTLPTGAHPRGSGSTTIGPGDTPRNRAGGGPVYAQANGNSNSYLEGNYVGDKLNGFAEGGYADKQPFGREAIPPAPDDQRFVGEVRSEPYISDSPPETTRQERYSRSSENINRETGQDLGIYRNENFGRQGNVPHIKEIPLYADQGEDNSHRHDLDKLSIIEAIRRNLTGESKEDIVLRGQNVLPNSYFTDKMFPNKGNFLASPSMGIPPIPNMHTKPQVKPKSEGYAEGGAVKKDIKTPFGPPNIAGKGGRILEEITEETPRGRDESLEIDKTQMDEGIYGRGGRLSGAREPPEGDEVLPNKDIEEAAIGGNMYPKWNRSRVSQDSDRRDRQAAYSILELVKENLRGWDAFKQDVVLTGKNALDLPEREQSKEVPGKKSSWWPFAEGGPVGNNSAQKKSFSEEQFQQDMRTAPGYKEWYDAYVQRYGEEPNLDDPDYDYRKAYSSGVKPTPYAPDNNFPHWSSNTGEGEPLKGVNHPTKWMEDYMKATGKDPNNVPDYAQGGFVSRLAMGGPVNDNFPKSNLVPLEAAGYMGAARAPLTPSSIGVQGREVTSTPNMPSIINQGPRVTAKDLQQGPDRYRVIDFNKGSESTEGVFNSAREALDFIDNHPNSSSMDYEKMGGSALPNDAKTNKFLYQQLQDLKLDSDRANDNIRTRTPKRRAMGGPIYNNNSNGYAQGGPTGGGPLAKDDPNNPNRLPTRLEASGYMGAPRTPELPSSIGVQRQPYYRTDLTKPNETVTNLVNQFKILEEMQGNMKKEGFDTKRWYHGTPKGFEQIDPYQSKYGLYGQGAHFTDSTDIATGYANKRHGPDWPYPDESARTIHPVALKVKNPLDMDAPADLANWAKNSMFKEYAYPEELTKNPKLTNHDVFKHIEEGLRNSGPYGQSEWEAGEAMQDGIRSMGHDAITHIGGARTGNKPHKVMIVFDPENIKSHVSDFNQGGILENDYSPRGYAEGGPAKDDTLERVRTGQSNEPWIPPAYNKPLPVRSTSSGPMSPGSSGNTPIIDRFKQTAEHLTRWHGVDPEVAKGAAKYMYKNESGLKPHIVNPQSGAYGIAQHLGPRKRAMMERFGPSPSFENQLEHISHELATGIGANDTLKRLLAAKGQGEKAGYDIWGRHFERPGEAALAKAGVKYSPGDVQVADASSRPNSGMPSPQKEIATPFKKEVAMEEEPEQEDQYAGLRDVLMAQVDPDTAAIINAILGGPKHQESMGDNRYA